MIDEAIETYVRGKLTTAYPDIEEAQALVLFPLALFQSPLSQRGNSIGQEVLTVSVIVVDVEKLERKLFIKQFARQIVEIGGVAYEQKFIRTEQKDWIEAVKNKGVIFTLQFTYDI